MNIDVSSEKGISIESESISLNRKVTTLFWIIAIALGALQAWDTRHAMNADGISYIDIADAYLRGDWNTAINAYWGPLYSWLIGMFMIAMKPTPYYEFSVVHLLNFIIYLCTLLSFHFMLTQLIDYNRLRQSKVSEATGVVFPDWAFITLGYALFINTSLNMISISMVTPDMCVAAFVYLASGIVLRIRSRAKDYFTFALLGTVLGFGYLAKSAMFPLSFIFFLVVLFSVGCLRTALPRVLSAFIVFILISGPFIIAISNAKGGLTFGESGKYNYWVHVNRNKPMHWNGIPPGSGHPKHPARKIFDNPEIYEFGTPVGGTYPLWYDPAYWHEGIKINVNLPQQFRAIGAEFKSYYELFKTNYSIMFWGSIITFLMGRRRWLVIKDIAQQWHILIPAIAALGMYSLVNVDDRYVGPFFVLLWLGIFSGIHLPASDESTRLLRNLTIVMALVVTLVTANFVIRGRNPVPPVHWQVSHALGKMGVSLGNRVASIGHSYGHFWARLAKVRIVSEIPDEEVNDFWNADSTVQSSVIRTFAGTGAKFIITDIMPSEIPPSGWKKIANTGYYVYNLSK